MEHNERIKRSVERNVEEGVKKGVKIIFFVILGIGIAFLVGYIVMRLWNWLMPELFGLPIVGYWQAVGILILAKIIFGFGSGDGPSNKSKKSKRKMDSKKCGALRKDFSEWKHYDEFWNQEGEKAFQDYLQRRENENKE
ncbi:hypothetical protein [Croceitalea rosinachiae]|uniref:Uncharacterized protein n=1 Tax=Croceitalea rosinachiae TaxID=3075596 RepID=A0ABU3A7W0_9FLAO|nr:hypothetical protein [Croceitalea sp. F388]MDT0606029.1 hypothetical protein [Croceitalea sp. F388]